MPVEQVITARSGVSKVMAKKRCRDRGFCRIAVVGVLLATAFCGVASAEEEGSDLEPDFQQWTGKPFSGNWRDDFELMSIEIPREADENNEWTVGYYIDAANHYFTARFISGKPKYNEIDG